MSLYDAEDMAHDRQVAHLKAFEADIAEEFNAGKIRAPVHLDDGCEDRLIEIFKDIQHDDWVFCGWRSHYRCLLKGVPPSLLKAEIMAGRSISLCLPQYRIVSSAIVGGNLPMAVGVAMAIKRAGGKERVHAFMGDMTALSGIAHECLTYSTRQDLPIRFIIEDNDVSVCTPTQAVWGPEADEYRAKIVHFRYKSKWPHAGAGKRINF